MNYNDRALLLGMLIGDGCLKVKPHKDTKYYEYVISHSTKQKEYLEHKLKIFHSIVGGKKLNISYGKTKWGESCRFSRCNKYFKLLHRYLYSNNNKKYITRKVLDWLNEQSLAIWYMDDGGLKLSYNNQKQVSSCQMILSTYCSEEQANIIINWFKEKWGIECRKLLHKKTNSFYLSFNTKEGKKLEELIKPYIISSMEYKLPSNRITRVLDTPSG